MEGELTIIDNLSGSIFHHYSSPAGCEKCHHDKQEVMTVPQGSWGLGVGGWLQSWWRASLRGELLWVEARQGLLDQGWSHGAVVDRPPP